MKKRILLGFLTILLTGVAIFYNTTQSSIKLPKTKAVLSSREVSSSKDVIVEEDEKGGKMISGSTSEKIKSYKNLMKKFAESNYAVINGKVAKVSQGPALTSIQTEEMEIANKALNVLKGKISVPEGAKTTIQLDEGHYVIVFENKLPEGTRGGDYSAKVVIDSKTGEILEILGGS